MDFALSAEQQALYATVAEFGREIVAPGAGERDRAGRFDRDVWDRCGAQGLCGLPIAEAYGGQGADALTTGVALEALGYGGRDSGLLLSLGAHLTIGAMPIELHGSEDLRARYLPKLATGERIGAFGVTEPDTGSDTASITTAAHWDAGAWVLNGTKTFITNGPIADVFTVVAVTDPEAAPGSRMTAFVLDTDTPGLTVGSVLDKMGNRSSPTSEMVLRDVRVGDEQRLGAVGTALWQVAFECFDWERTVMLASTIGGMRATLEACLAYARERTAFGKPIASFQAISHKLAEMRIRLETARLALRHAAWLKDQGLPHQTEASIAKAHVAEAATRNAEDAIQIHGGWGYIKDFPVERSWRDAKLTSLGGGTTEIQKLVIARELLGETGLV